MQAIAQGHLPDLMSARQVVRESIEVETFSPENTDDWQEAGEKFGAITGTGA